MTAAPIVDVELSPVARQNGVTYVHDVALDAGVELGVGDQLRLRDEGGTAWDATVVAVEVVRFGRKYRLTIRPATN
jgi:hypothetical protein